MTGRVRIAWRLTARVGEDRDSLMTTNRVPEALLQQEVRELTDLLRNERSFADLRELLTAKERRASQVILAGLIDGEDTSRYGAILTLDHE